MSQEILGLSRRVLRHMDLTSLGQQDEAEGQSIQDLLKVAQKAPVAVASFCTWPQFISLVVQANDESSRWNPPGLPIVPCTVVNFPQGDQPRNSVATSIANALSLGAREIDYVLDYNALIRGDRKTVEEGLQACRRAVPSEIPLKVILETAALLPHQGLVREASVLALDAGADFLKTSTGKHPRGGASTEAIALMLEAIGGQSRPVGIKASGGLRKVEDVHPYFDLADRAFGQEATTKQLRLGASRSLFDDAMLLLSGPSTASRQTPPAPSSAHSY